MIVKQIYTGCLFQGAYYIESNGEAAVIDPLREVSEYLNLAKSSNSLRGVFSNKINNLLKNLTDDKMKKGSMR